MDISSISNSSSASHKNFHRWLFPSLGAACIALTLAGTARLRAEDMAPLPIKLPAPAFIGTTPESRPDSNKEYFETHWGKLINAKGIKARFVRLYSKGSTDSAMNEYTEVEVYGRPTK